MFLPKGDLPTLSTPVQSRHVPRDDRHRSCAAMVTFALGDLALRFNSGQDAKDSSATTCEINQTITHPLHDLNPFLLKA